MENNNPTLANFLQNDYAEFVKTTFAYTHKKYRTECATDVLEQFQDLQRKHDIVHCAYGILNEYVEFGNECTKYGELLIKQDQLQSMPGYEQYPTEKEIKDQEIAVLKEIGDIYYYKTMLFNLLNLEHKPQQPRTNTPDQINEGLPIEMIGDIIKKYVYYEHELNVVALESASIELDKCFTHICEKLNTTLHAVIAANEAKLRKRYPSGTFTSQEAAAKADTHG